jgi:cytochrome c oxidase assembly protein subunit 15
MDGSKGLHRFAVLVCAATFALIFAGGLVTSTDSGLAVPDWPLSFGRLFPPMTGGVLYEHGHRMVAASVGILVVVLYVWARLRARRAVAALAAWALGAVVIQGLLGGLTVLMRLPPAVSVAHACLAQAFLCLTVALAAATGDAWRRAGDLREAAPGPPLRALALATTAAVYGQLVLGAVVRHTKAGLAIPDFPLAFGRLVPPLESPEVRIHFAHRVWALAVLGTALWTAARVLRAHREELLLRRPAVLLIALLGAQTLLGGLTIWTRRAPVPTTFHVLVGAMVLGASLLLTLRAWRMAAPARAAAPGRTAVREAAA